MDSQLSGVGVVLRYASFSSSVSCSVSWIMEWCFICCSGFVRATDLYCLRLARDLLRPATVFGPVDRPPCQPQRPLPLNGYSLFAGASLQGLPVDFAFAPQILTASLRARIIFRLRLPEPRIAHSTPIRPSLKLPGPCHIDATGANPRPTLHASTPVHVPLPPRPCARPTQS